MGKDKGEVEHGRHNQRGQAAVELVLLTPLLLVLIFLIFELGRVFGSWLIVTNAAREGARFAVVQDFDPAADAAIQARVQSTAQFLSVDAVPCSGGYNSCIQITRTTDGMEKLVTVTTSYKVYTLTPITVSIPYFGTLNYPGFLEVAGRSTMRWE